MASSVIDSNVIVASFLSWEPNHQQGREIIEGLDDGEDEFHLPMLVVVEVAAAIRRRSGYWMAMQAVWNQNVLDWEAGGKLVLYPLERTRMDLAISVTQRIGLRGSDSVVVTLAEELRLPLRTFDQEIIDRVPLASP